MYQALRKSTLILRTTFMILFLSYFTNISDAQPITSKDNGLKEITLKDAKLGLIRFYIDTENIAKKAPMFIEINGSGGTPLCVCIKGKGFSATSDSFSPDLIAATKKNGKVVNHGDYLAKILKWLKNKLVR